ncbi:methionyl-tRNA formyltransferase [Aestuariimicrobium kwangyangense]|uniref:methionyl-tRNA formyltransferase n=1 Tax=Aestuariimicrobium kwangyangense TaxID=396389 RepID=UPI0003B3527B
MTALKIGFAGTPEVALPALAALAESEHEVAVVITRPDAPAGRGKKLTASSVAQLAAELGIPVLKPSHPRDPEFQAALVAFGLDAVAVVAYGALLPQSALDLVPHGWVNLHFSLLPRWRGAAPVQRAIWEGDQVTGATTFRIVRALDAGPVFGTIETPVRSGQTAGELLDELSQSGAQLLVKTMSAIADGAEPTEQADEGLTVAAKITVDDAHVDFGVPTDAVDRQIRAVTPAPGAWAQFTSNGVEERFKIVSATPVHLDEPLGPGELRATKRALLVGTVDGGLELVRVQPHGKKQMAGADWARGVQVTGARLS